MSDTPQQLTVNDLPGLNCGLCGARTCVELAERLQTDPTVIERCIHLSPDLVSGAKPVRPAKPATATTTATAATPVATGAAPATVCGSCALAPEQSRALSQSAPTWQDTLGRGFDFYLEHFAEDPGPREIMLPHNPMLTREMNIQVGDILIGRPLGMSCGCPITHCGVVMQVDPRTGVIVWCVTGPLNPRQKGFKDIGYYIAEGYEGLVTQSRVEIKIGMRYFFQPRMCMLQWRHSGLVNFMNRSPEGIQVRLEGLWIG
jgi:uncharacterized Fe-S cluster-containing protein